MGEFGNSNTNRQSTSGFDAGIYVYTRWSDTQKLIVVTNFSWIKSSFELKVPSNIIQKWFEWNLYDYGSIV
jgi:glycosidase